MILMLSSVARLFFFFLPVVRCIGALSGSSFLVYKDLLMDISLDRMISFSLVGSGVWVL